MRRSLALVVVLSLAATACGGDDEGIDVTAAAGSGGDFEYTIPVGAGEALDRGEPLEILPARIDATVGQVIEIVNEDDRGHLVGPFFVGVGETLRQQFVSPGEFTGICTVHPSGQLILVVEEP